MDELTSRTARCSGGRVAMLDDRGEPARPATQHTAVLLRVVGLERENGRRDACSRRCVVDELTEDARA